MNMDYGTVDEWATDETDYPLPPPKTDEEIEEELRRIKEKYPDEEESSDEDDKDEPIVWIDGPLTFDQNRTFELCKWIPKTEIAPPLVIDHEENKKQLNKWIEQEDEVSFESSITITEERMAHVKERHNGKLQHDDKPGVFLDYVIPYLPQMVKFMERICCFHNQGYAHCTYLEENNFHSTRYTCQYTFPFIVGINGNENTAVKRMHIVIDKLEIDDSMYICSMYPHYSIKYDD